MTVLTTSYDSLIHIRDFWYPCVQKCIEVNSCCCLLVGNKIDEGEIDPTEVDKVAMHLGIERINISLKESTNCE